VNAPDALTVPGPLLRAERAGAALVVTLARAPVNAINDALLAELDAVLDAVEADESLSVLHLRSAQKVFSAGADLELIRSSTATPQGRNRMVAIVLDMQRVFARLEYAPCVTIAELGGAAVGGGFELALACDWRIAAHEARVGLPEAGLGLLAAGGGTQRLTHLVGPGIARRLILGAETVDGREAERLGLVQWSVPRAELAGAARTLAARCAAVPRATLAENKRCIALAGAPHGDGYAAEIAATRRLYENPETRRRVAAFLDKGAAPSPAAKDTP
jgi:enoyl-CoA hydratase/carnithine racemase